MKCVLGMLFLNAAGQDIDLTDAQFYCIHWDAAIVGDFHLRQESCQERFVAAAGFTLGG